MTGRLDFVMLRESEVCTPSCQPALYSNTEGGLKNNRISLSYQEKGKARARSLS